MYDFLAKLFMKKLDSNSIPVDSTRSSAAKLKKQLDFATVMETCEHHNAIVNLSRHLNLNRRLTILWSSMMGAEYYAEEN